MVKNLLTGDCMDESEDRPPLKDAAGTTRFVTASLEDAAGTTRFVSASLEDGAGTTRFVSASLEDAAGTRFVEEGQESANAIIYRK